MTPPRSQRIAAALTILACVAVAIGIAAPMIYYCQPADGGLACGWTINRHGSTDDSRFFTMLWETTRVSIQDFHQFPSWNPYHCGGVVLFQDPGSPFPGPLYLLTFLWLPAAAGTKVWYILHLIIGALGARALVKEMGANSGEQILAAAIVTACGFCAEHFGGGHLSFAPFLYLPWILWAHRRALYDPRWAVLVAALFAASFYEGATYPIPLMLVTVAFDSLLRLGHRRERHGLYLSLPIIGVLFPLLSGVRLIPVLNYLREHPRLVPLDDQMTVSEVFQTWLARTHDRSFPGHTFVWPEYGDYVGAIPVALMLLGVTFALVRKDEHTRSRRLDAFLLAMLVWTTLGNIPGFSIYSLLHELPIYRSLRVPSRYLYPCTVALAMLAASALITVRRLAADLRIRPRLVRAFVVLEVALALFVGVDMCVANSPRIQQGIDPAMPRSTAGRDFYQDPGVPYGELSSFPVRGVGTPQCYVPLEWGPAHGLWMGRGPQSRVVPEDAGRATQTLWSPNELRFSVNLERPATLLVNQNYETSWSSSAGTLSPQDGILGVELPAGRHDVVLRHRPAGLLLGLFLMLVGITLAVLIVRRLTPERAATLRARWLARITEPLPTRETAAKDSSEA